MNNYIITINMKNVYSDILEELLKTIHDKIKEQETKQSQVSVLWKEKRR